MIFASGVKGDLKLPLIAAEEDSGPLVKALVESTPGKNLIAYREWMTLEEMVRVFTEATGLPAQYVTLGPGEPDIPLPDGLKEELDDNWAYFNECGYEGRDDPSVMHPNQVRYSLCNPHANKRLTFWQLEVAPKLGTVSDWIKKQDWRFVSKA